MTSSRADAVSPPAEWQAMLPYVAPILIFGVMTTVEASSPPEWFIALYALKIGLVVAALAIWRAPLLEMSWSAAAVPGSVAIGLVAFAVWIGIDQLIPYAHFGDRTAFDPSVIGSPEGRAAFLALRFAGLVAVVPVMEEIFWRSFVLRYFTSGGFPLAPIGVFSTLALAAMTIGSALAHPEWLVAAITSVMYAFWIRRTRSVSAVIVAHAVTNAALGAYVVMTGRWEYW